VRAALLVRGATPMDTVLEILRALASIASIARLLFELWKEHKHKADSGGR
jgi:hypothetical protein